MRVFNYFRSNINYIFYILLFIILFAAFLIRVINLNYNTAFVDEASSILVGKLGVFEGDWWSYNGVSWMSGNPLINPALSGLAYVSGELYGSRLLSAIIGVLTIESVIVLTILIVGPDKQESYVAGLISGFLLAFSPVAIFISRMTTYDMKSFFLMFMCITILQWIKYNRYKSGKWYFISFIFLFLALLAKVIILIYLPLILFYAYYIVKKDKKMKFYCIRYFMIPALLFIGGYLVLMFFNLFSFAGLQTTKETFSYIDIFLRIYNNVTYELWYALIGGIVLYFTNKKLLLSLFIMAIWILLSHIVTRRALWTMDKQIFITSAFLIIIAGIGLTELIKSINLFLIKYISIFLLMISFYFYFLNTQHKLVAYNNTWINTLSVEKIMKDKVKNGDKILTETGSPIILALYDLDLPTNITTFSWFNYNNNATISAYKMAVSDGYFDWIELINEEIPREEYTLTIHNYIVNTVKTRYKLIYSDKTSSLYRRVI